MPSASPMNPTEKEDEELSEGRFQWVSDRATDATSEISGLMTQFPYNHVKKKKR